MLFDGQHNHSWQLCYPLNMHDGGMDLRLYDGLDLLCVHSSFVIILKRKRNLVALLLLFYRRIVTINVLWLFLLVPYVFLQYVIVVFSDHTNLLFYLYMRWLGLDDASVAGPLGFNYWSFFLYRYSVVCTVEPLSLFYLLFTS